MKKQIQFFLILVIGFHFLASTIKGQKTTESSTVNIVENSEKPLHPKAGRIIVLEEIMRFEDVTEDYYFKYPHTFKIAPDGSIFLMDEKQLLRFDGEGRFLHNYFKPGQGPGEMQRIRGYCFHDQMLVAHNSRPHKIIWFDLNGDFIREFPIRNVTFIEFQFYNKDKYYFFCSNIPDTKGKPMVVEAPHDLICISQEGKKTETLTSFPVKTYAVGSGRGGAAVGMGALIAVPYKNKYLFLTHTPEYLIKLYDVESQKIIRQFRRSFPRVKWPKARETGSIGWNGKFYKPPPQKHVNDIDELVVVGDRLWVITAKIDKKKGVLVDIFDFEGQYTDSFYLQFPENVDLKYSVSSIAISHGLLYHQERNEDETICVVKYKMLDSN